MHLLSLQTLALLFKLSLIRAFFLFLPIAEYRVISHYIGCDYFLELVKGTVVSREITIILLKELPIVKWQERKLPEYDKMQHGLLISYENPCILVIHVELDLPWEVSVASVLSLTKEQINKKEIITSYDKKALEEVAQMINESFKSARSIDDEDLGKIQVISAYEFALTEYAEMEKVNVNAPINELISLGESQYKSMQQIGEA